MEELILGRSRMREAMKIILRSEAANDLYSLQKRNLLRRSIIRSRGLLYKRRRWRCLHGVRGNVREGGGL